MANITTEEAFWAWRRYFNTRLWERPLLAQDVLQTELSRRQSWSGGTIGMRALKHYRMLMAEGYGPKEYVSHNKLDLWISAGRPGERPITHRYKE